MIHIGGDALQSIDQKLSEGTNIFILRGQDTHLCGLCSELGHIIREPHGTVVQRPRSIVPALLLQLIAKLQSLSDERNQSVIVKVCIGNCREEGLCRETSVFPVYRSRLFRLFAIDRESLQDIDEQILKSGRIFLFPADTLNGAAVILCRFLTLITKHVISSLVMVDWLFCLLTRYRNADLITLTYVKER